MSRSCFLLGAAGVAMIVTRGCALRATTDFGSQSATSRQSVNAGPEGLPGIPILGGRGADAGGGPGESDGPGLGNSPFSSDGGAAGSGGGH